MYLSGDQVVEGVGISQISRQNESLPITTLRAVADPKQSVTQGGLYLEGNVGYKLEKWKSQKGKTVD